MVLKRENIVGINIRMKLVRILLVHHQIIIIKSSSKSARISRREARAAEDELFDQEEGIMYGPGIAD